MNLANKLATGGAYLNDQITLGNQLLGLRPFATQVCLRLMTEHLYNIKMR